MKRKRYVDYVDPFKGVNPKTKKLKTGKKKSIKRSSVEDPQIRSKETCLFFSAVNLVNIFQGFDGSNFQSLFQNFNEEFDIDHDGAWIVDIYQYLKKILGVKDYEWKFLSDLKGLKKTDEFFKDYESMRLSGELYVVEDAEKTIKEFLSNSYVRCCKEMKCTKCSKKLPFKIEGDRTHSVVLLNLDPEGKYVFYLDSEVIGKKSTCNFCKILLRKLVASLPKKEHAKEFIAVRKKV